jgi:predicted ATPase
VFFFAILAPLREMFFRHTDSTPKNILGFPAKAQRCKEENSRSYFAPQMISSWFHEIRASDQLFCNDPRAESDGTLRYLCLLAILCDPEPPPLVCIEQPELGLHPDILPKVADLLLQASQRTQDIVTTHSDVLVDAMTEHPEAVVVCEKHEGESEMHRLRQDELASWLGKYRLGQLWTRGQIGGTRW